MNLQERFQFTEGKSLPSSVMQSLPVKKPPKPTPQQRPEAEISSSPQDLFEMIVGEIEERQKFLSDLKTMGQLTSDIEHRVKGEIAERFGDLQKLRNLSN